MSGNDGTVGMSEAEVRWRLNQVNDAMKGLVLRRSLTPVDVEELEGRIDNVLRALSREYRPAPIAPVTGRE